MMPMSREKKTKHIFRENSKLEKDTYFENIPLFKSYVRFAI